MKKNTILIVDDEPNVRLTYRIALESSVAGLGIDPGTWEVFEAGSGEAAMELLKSRRFDVVVLDLRLPGVSGLDLLAAMRESNIGTPVVIVTAYGTVPHAVQAMKLGAIDFLEKPVTPDQLREVVADVVNRHLTTKPATLKLLTDSSLHLLFAKRAINDRNFDEARLHLKEALKQNDRLMEAHNLLGVLCEMGGDYDNAKRCYGRAIAIDSQYQPAQQNMRRIYELFQFGSSDEPFNLGDK